MLYGDDDVRAQNQSYTKDDGTTEEYKIRGGKKTVTNGDAAAGVLVRDFNDGAARDNPRIEYSVFELEPRPVPYTAFCTRRRAAPENTGAFTE